MKKKYHIFLFLFFLIVTKISFSQPGCGLLNINFLNTNYQKIILDSTNKFFSKEYTVTAYSPKFQIAKKENYDFPDDFQKEIVWKNCGTSQDSSKTITCFTLMTEMNYKKYLRIVIAKKKETMIVNIFNFPNCESKYLIDSVCFKKGVLNIDASKLNFNYLDPKTIDLSNELKFYSYYSYTSLFSATKNKFNH